VVLLLLGVELGISLVDNAQSEKGESPVVMIASLILLLTGVTWWFVRAVRLRIFMSADWPRSLLLGPLRGRGFWVRVAFLIGLPSSLWNLAALRTAAFWMFVVSRPLVYLGCGVFKINGLPRRRNRGSARFYWPVAISPSMRANGRYAACLGSGKRGEPGPTDIVPAQLRR
jgi:hypothetical protein